MLEFVSNFSWQITFLKNWGLWNKPHISKLQYNLEQLLIICVFIKKKKKAIAVWFFHFRLQKGKIYFLSILDKNKARIDFAFHSLKKKQVVLYL